jgi:hypothetical protein
MSEHQRYRSIFRPGLLEWRLRIVTGGGSEIGRCPYFGRDTAHRRRHALAQCVNGYGPLRARPGIENDPGCR